MAEIKINTEKLEEEIQKLRDLAQKCERIDVDQESVEGSGESIAMVTAIDKEYSAVKEGFRTLLENSVSFFENVRNSAAEADNKAADKLK